MAVTVTRLQVLRHATPRRPTPRHPTPRHATPRHATPRHATPRHATPRHATPRHLNTHGSSPSRATPRPREAVFRSSASFFAFFCQTEAGGGVGVGVGRPASAAAPVYSMPRQGRSTPKHARVTPCLLRDQTLSLGGLYGSAAALVDSMLPHAATLRATPRHAARRRGAAWRYPYGSPFSCSCTAQRGHE